MKKAISSCSRSGAIVLHIAQRHAGLLPDDANARARAITWMFAALNTVEPPILELITAKFLERDKPWYAQRLPLVEDRIRDRLDELSARLGDADWLDGAFSAGDLMMVSVLLRLKASGLLDEYPNLAAYVARGEARPAYQRAFAAQLAVFTGKAAGWPDPLPPAGPRQTRTRCRRPGPAPARGSRARPENPLPPARTRSRPRARTNPSHSTAPDRSGRGADRLERVSDICHHFPGRGLVEPVAGGNLRLRRVPRLQLSIVVELGVLVGVAVDVLRAIGLGLITITQQRVAAGCRRQGLLIFVGRLPGLCRRPAEDCDAARQVMSDGVGVDLD